MEHDRKDFMKARVYKLSVFLFYPLIKYQIDQFSQYTNLIFNELMNEWMSVMTI